MRHKNSGRKFDRNTSSRRAMLRNLAANLILHERIETTDAKAKELRRVAERLITKARRLGPVAYTPQADLSVADRARRLAASRAIAAYVPRFGVRVEEGGATKRVDLVEKVLIELSRRFANRPGGYTRIVKFGPRRGDNAPISLIELVDELSDTSSDKGGKKAEAKAPTAPEPTQPAQVTTA
ncbi:MAG TPA: 50S ribosomal protein L17 [Polyangiaceae bacterium]|nr:50S ribosomal protein L17 [Polyangiaceae bacterium]